MTKSKELESMGGGLGLEETGLPEESRISRVKKRNKSKDKFSSKSTVDIGVKVAKRFSPEKLSKNGDMLEYNLAKFNSMLTFSILKSKHWTKETFYDTTYCTFLEQFIELVPKITQRKGIIFHCPDFVKGLFEFTFKLLKYNSQVHFSEA